MSIMMIRILKKNSFNINENIIAQGPLQLLIKHIKYICNEKKKYEIQIIDKYNINIVLKSKSKLYKKRNMICHIYIKLLQSNSLINQNTHIYTGT